MNSYTATRSKPTATNRSNPCPVCGKTNGNCRYFPDSDLALCMTGAGGSLADSHWHHIKDTKDGLWGEYVPNTKVNHSSFDHTQHLLDRARKVQEKEAERLRHQQTSLDTATRHQEYTKALSRLELRPEHRQKLRDRGYPDPLIDAMMFRSYKKGQLIGSGIDKNLPGIVTDAETGNQTFYLAASGAWLICPTWCDGQIVGHQFRAIFETDRHKYIYGSKAGLTPPQYLPSGELPISYYQASELRSPFINLTESGCIKPSLLAHLIGGVVIGAIGGNFASSPNHLKELLSKAETRLNTKQVLLWLDAGDINNPLVMRRWEKVKELLEQLGYEVYIAWWGQYSKDDDLDADELTNYSQVQFIAWDEFTESIVNSFEWLTRFESQRQTKPTELQNQRYINVSSAPKSGIVVLISAKNTGKTYALSQLIKDEPKVIALSHLIALARNICNRLDLQFRNDLDRANGYLIDDTGDYADLDKFGLCVHSILMLEIAKYAGGTLVWDELDQGLRELIAGQHCNQLGQRPALLDAIEQLLKIVNRVIVSSADITDAELEWICKVRGELNPHIIKNDFKPKGYPVYVFPKQGDLLSQLLDDIEAGQRVYIFCDSKKLADEIYAVVAGILGEDKTLLITSDTTPKDQGAIEYMRDPNPNVDKWQAVVASPSACTGISIETKTNGYDCVYGFIEGKSILGSDVAQALARVRATVPRKIWVRKAGTRFSRFSKSTDYKEILQVLETGANNEIRILCAMFKMMLPTFNLADNPHAIYWAKSEANRNASMFDLKTDVIERLRYDSNFVFEVDYKKLPKHEKERIAENHNIFKGQSDQLKAAYKQQYLNAPRLPDNDFKDLAAKKIKTPVEQITVKANYTMRDFGAEQMTENLFKYADSGNNRTRLLETLFLIAPGYAATESHKQIEKMHQRGHGLTAWDIKTCTARTQLRRELGLLDLYLDLLANPDQTLTNENCKPIADKVRDRLDEVKAILKPTFKSTWGNYAIVKNLLEQLLIDFTMNRNTTGDRNRTVTVNLKTLQQHEHVLRHNYKSRNLEELSRLFIHCNDTMGDVWAARPAKPQKTAQPPETSQGEMSESVQMESVQMNQYKTSLVNLDMDNNQTSEPISTNNNQLVDVDKSITSYSHGLNISSNAGDGEQVGMATVNPHESALADAPVATIPIKRETASLADRITQFLKAKTFPEPSPTCHTVAYIINQAVAFKSASEALTEGTKALAGWLPYESSLAIWGLLPEPTRAKLAAMVLGEVG